MDRQHDAATRQRARQRGEDRRSDRVVVEDVGAILAREHRNPGGEPAVHERLEMLGRRSRDVAHPHAPVFGDAVRGVVCPRVHGYLVTTLDEAGADLLDVMLDTANCGWNTTLPDEGDAGRLHAARGSIVRFATA